MPGAEDVAALSDAFRRRGLRPRLELVLPSPALPVLEAGGFTVEQRLPLMVLGRLVPASAPGVELSLATSDDDLAAAARVQDLSYGDTVDPDNPARLARTVGGGGHVALARIDGQPVGSGLVTGPSAGRVPVAELAAVGTLPTHRRRGVAGAVSSLLAGTALGEGTTPYLQAEGEAERRIYERLGFETVGELAVVSLRD